MASGLAQRGACVNRRNGACDVATRLTLLACAATASARTGGFATADEPVDEGGRRRAAAFRIDGPRPDRVVTSPALAAIATASQLGFAALPEPRLGDQGHGAWSGKSFDAVAAEAPGAFRDWLAAPDAGAPGGEPLAAVCERAGEWLDAQRDADAAVLAITHPMVVRALLSHALSIPLQATLDIDIAPLGSVGLSYNGRWRLQSLSPPGSDRP
jgi:broad specificity phosphatase PhoE